MAASTPSTDNKVAASQALSRFQFERLLNQDQAGRRISLLGSIDSQPAIFLAERAALSNDNNLLTELASSLSDVQNLGVNDIYSWFMASSGQLASKPGVEEAAHDVKVNLIWPCTPKHIVKYSEQGVRSVTETPEIYREHVRPYMQRDIDDGRLNWIYDILEGRAEQDDVMHRRVSDEDAAENEGFMLLPDLNWDRKTIASLHCLGICERRDLWSVRDLCKKHVPFLKHMRQKLLDATAKLYPPLEEDQLKLYVHYQPTYYHFHIHVVNVMSDPGTTQAVGKALSLDNIIDQLERMDSDEDGMHDVTLTYTVGEASELWTNIFEPLKREKLKRKRGD